ncbi:hypothetical protein [Shewanella algae]|uniref:hypothetical protein n=1 Tax=Shewanella algae TaxID=38313 RepID=UPI0031F4A647
MKRPWELNPLLSKEKLKKLAGLLYEVRNSVVDLHDGDLGDTARGTGLRAYECCRTNILRASASKGEWSWLGIIKPDGRFTFSIDSVPVRFYRGSPDNPQERRMIPCEAAMCQMELLSADIGDIASIQWFIAIEVDENRYAERVTFTGYDNGMQVSCWEVPLDVKPTALAGVTEQLPEPVKIKKARVSVKRKDKNKDAQNDGQ